LAVVSAVTRSFFALRFRPRPELNAHPCNGPDEPFPETWPSLYDTVRRNGPNRHRHGKRRVATRIRYRTDVFLAYPGATRPVHLAATKSATTVYTARYYGRSFGFDERLSVTFYAAIRRGSVGFEVSVLQLPFPNSVIVARLRR